LKIGLGVPLLSFSLVSYSLAHAQAKPAAIQNLSISAFGGVSGTYTGLDQSRNLWITAGADLSFRPFHGLYPSAEFRGSYPIDNGGLAGERNILGGIRIEKYYGRFHPYGDALFGRDKIEYLNGGFPNASGTLLYQITISNAWSVGGGVDIDLTPHLAAKFDGQLQHYETPVTASGDIYAKAYTAAVVYRFDFNHHFHYDKRTGQVTNLPKEPAPRPLPPPPPGQPAPSPDSTTPAPDSTTPPPSDSTPPPAPAPPAPAPDSTTPPASTPPATDTTTPPSTPPSSPPAPQPQQPQ
jgi:hypothetical protein